MAQTTEDKLRRWDDPHGEYGMSCRSDIEDAILLLAEHGFEIVNKRGGYFTRREGFDYFHQTCYRSTYTPDDKMEALDSFLSESAEHLADI